MERPEALKVTSLVIVGGLIHYSRNCDLNCIRRIYKLCLIYGFLADSTCFIVFLPAPILHNFNRTMIGRELFWMIMPLKRRYRRFYLVSSFPSITMR